MAASARRRASCRSCLSASYATRRAVIVDAEWSGLRVRLRAEGGDGLVADLKLGTDGEGRSIADQAAEVDADGRTSLLVPDDT